MEPAARSRTEHKLMGNPDLVAEILRRAEFGSSKTFIQCCAFSKSWREAVRNGTVVRSFAERNKPENLGFLVEFGREEDRVVKLLYGTPSARDDYGAALRNIIDEEILQLDNILDSQDGIMLIKAPAVVDKSSKVYYTSCYFDYELVYKPEASEVPEIPRDPAKHTINTYGQFAVLPGDGTSGLSFFIHDPATVFDIGFDGVTFQSTADIFVHVCVLECGEWKRKISKPIVSPEVAKFHTKPYSVVVGGKIYMMYHLKYIVCLEIGNTNWTEIPLPVDMEWRCRTYYDYSVARTTSQGIVLVNYSRGKVKRWVLSHTATSSDWALDSTVNLVDKGIDGVSRCCWARVFFCEDLEIVADNYYSVQIRKASVNGRFVLLTLGFAEGMFEVDMEMQTVKKINCRQSARSIGRILDLTERWPPKP